MASILRTKYHELRTFSRWIKNQTDAKVGVNS